MSRRGKATAAHAVDSAHALVWELHAHPAKLGALPSGTATIAATATLLSVHPRTLQRQLRARDVTFTQVPDEARRELADQYLTTTDLPLGQIAALIGFSEQSALCYAVTGGSEPTPAACVRPHRPRRRAAGWRRPVRAPGREATGQAAQPS
ncbi:helix-turn-helix domain-containing protein [Nocardioides pelophilus]|uniref:helix-turn-helix domain-containing protein n=1 Tax=Nocardioides pelophilus TaxID=2172019 RepID=UPI0016019975|nr:helix-turn-helix domain-containing protein [Nocardioides pelophilus]